MSAHGAYGFSNRLARGSLELAVPTLLALAMLANAAVVPLVPFGLATVLGWSLWSIGLYSFCLMAVTIVANRILSTRVDVLRRRTILGVVCAAFQVAGALAAAAAFAGTEWLIVLSLIGTAVGGAVAPIYYTLGRMIRTHSVRSAAGRNSALRVITSASWVAGPAAGFAISGAVGITTALIIAAAIALVGLILAISTSNVIDSHISVDDHLVSHNHPQKQFNRGKLRGQIRIIAPGFMMVFFFSIAHISTATSLPLLLVRKFDVPETLTGLFLGLKAATEMIAILLVPLASKRWSLKHILLVSGFLALATYSLYLFGHGEIWATVAAVLEGTYYGLFAVTALTWIQGTPGFPLGRATGLYMNGIYFGVLIGAPLSGLVAGFNLRNIAGLSLISVLIVLVLLTLVKFRSKDAFSIRTLSS